MRTTEVLVTATELVLVDFRAMRVTFKISPDDGWIELYSSAMQSDDDRVGSWSPARFLNRDGSDVETAQGLVVASGDAVKVAQVWLRTILSVTGATFTLGEL